MTTRSTQVAGAEQQFVIFDLGSEAYGVDIGTVREIIRMQQITAVPNAGRSVEGVINLRGKVIPVVDLRKRFGLEATEHTKETRIVVADIGNADIGVIVDAVTEVMRIASDAIEVETSGVKNQSAEFHTGIAKLADRLIILLDLNGMLSQDDASSETAGTTATRDDT